MDLRKFKKSVAYKLFTENYEIARKQANETRKRVPNGIGEFLFREQLLGQIDQLDIVLEWFDGEIERLVEILKKNED